MLYRKLGLAGKGENGAYVVNESSPEVMQSRNRTQSTSRGKQPRAQLKYERKQPEITKRSPFSMNGPELESSRAVRKKIEEFRQWHEEQYRLKLEALKARAAKDNNGKIKAAEALALANIYKDKVTPLNEIKPTNHSDLDPTLPPDTYRKRSSLADHLDATGPALDSLPRLTSRGILHTSRLERSITDMDHGSRDAITPRPESPPARIPSEIRERVHSAKTWQTWRDINQSDAYNDVKRYIKDNDLLGGDKEKHIRDWLARVDQAMLSGHCANTNGQVVTLERQNSDLTSSYTSDTS
jgi:hypothetical protein